MSGVCVFAQWAFAAVPQERDRFLIDAKEIKKQMKRLFASSELRVSNFSVSVEARQLCIRVDSFLVCLVYATAFYGFHKMSILIAAGHCMIAPVKRFRSL